MKQSLPQLPVSEILLPLETALAEASRAVLHAPPGAGKTTLIPLALADAPWLAGLRIIMLEPRRVAARAAAHRMADLIGEPVGKTVGFRTRTESRVGPQTRIEVVTEGILTRRIQRDPTLEGVGLVIFDEFHERNLVADLGLALTLRTREVLREDLRVLIMSATLDTARVARLLDNAPVISAEGRSFPVETRYVAPRDPRAVDAAVVTAIRRALSNDPGNILVFLPGVPEIHRAIEALRVVDDVEVLTLHGSLSSEEQDRALRASDRRRVVLATSIAETSLTVPGVRVVIDSGWARRPTFSPSTGMTRLETRRVSRATADQRRGRAGRTNTGVCYRLWPEHEDLVEAPVPEILDTDLAPLALDLAAAGVTSVNDLDWLDVPPPGSYAAAGRLLRELDLLDTEGKLTATGRTAVSMPLHPRLAHMLLRAAPGEARRMATDLAALLAERDVVRFPGPEKDADIRLRLEIIDAVRHKTGIAVGSGVVVLRDVADRVVRESQRLHSLLTDPGDVADADAGALLALAYPDRVAMRRTGQRGRYIARDGLDVLIDPATLLASESFIVAAELDGRRPVSRAYLAAGISPAVVEALFTRDIETVREVEWNESTQSVTAFERRRLGSIVLSERAVAAEGADVAAALLKAVVGRGLLVRDDFRELLSRIAFAHRVTGNPALQLESTAVEESASEWLLPSLHGLRTLADADRVDVGTALLSRLDFRTRAQLDEVAPQHVVVPTGTRVRVDYSDVTAPAIAVRIQELFGLTETPRVGLGRVPLTIHLLSPAHRPVQVTRDLAGFWKNSYFDVRKDLRGRYPKHPWPDDPANAVPTRRAKPR